MYTRSFIFIALLFSLILGSCKTPKTALVSGKSTNQLVSILVDTMAQKIIRKTNETERTKDWFSARARVEYNSENISQEFTVVMRMRMDSILWLSLQGPFGIEGVRVLITPDSIFIVNKLSNEYLHQPISYLSKIMPIETNLHQLQDFLLGYYLLFPGAAPEYRGLNGVDSLYLIQAETPQFRYRTWFYRQNYTLGKSLLTDKMQGQEMNITFDGYSHETGQPFSHERIIDIKQGKKNINLHMTFGKIKVNEILSFPFEVGPAMKEVDNIGF